MCDLIWTQRYDFEVDWKMNDTWAPNEEKYEAIERIFNSAKDGPVLIININKYHASAGFPNGKPMQTGGTFYQNW